MDTKLFSRDFTLVVIGQIISLFGNAAIRFALPLYLLNITGSSALYGAVSACAFIPAVLLSPAGGIVADRVNKRNIMVILDFFTGAVILDFLLLMEGVSLIPLLTVTMMLLYGIAGAYQPAVSASIPALVGQRHFMQANSVINTISAFSSLTGPVLGGILYSAWGLAPVLWMCVACFVMSAAMELFIRIPFQRQRTKGGILRTAAADFAESIRFIRREKPALGKGMMILCAINLFLSSMIVVALPYLTTQVLELDPALANRLCGFAQGALAAGGLAGGICAGLLDGRLSVSKAPVLLSACAACVFPLGIGLALFSTGMVNYVVLTLCSFFVMFFATIFSVQMLSFIQAWTPRNLVGKVISLVLTISMCAQPAGNAFYGALFEMCKGSEYVAVLFAGGVSMLIALCSRKIFREISDGESEERK